MQYNRYHQRYVLKPQSGPYELSKYHSDTALFLSLLDPSISLTIRTPANVGYDFSYLQRKVRYDLSDQSFESVLPSYALYCVDHLGTTMLESISMGIPTIVILDKRFVKYHGEAQKIMASLESIGVIHYSPKTAAAFVNDNFLTIDRWWQSAPVQASLQNFIQRFARASDNPEARLIHYLQSFLS
jgi:putative transferase (TIGR04331 family)